MVQNSFMAMPLLSSKPLCCIVTISSLFFLSVMESEKRIVSYSGRYETTSLTILEFSILSMMAGRPIIALISGELGGSEVRSIIESGGMGFAYEQASAEKDRQIKRRLYNFICVLTALAFAAVAAGIVRRVFRMFSDYMLVEYSELLGVLPFAVLLTVFLFKLQDGIDNKYYLEK